MDKDKIDYLVKTLSRTKRKDYENYVVNRIYHKLNDFDIKPVTQQYVKKSDGYYLIDLYFPQFNLGVECDEAHHSKQVESDKLRFEDIAFAINGYAKSDYKERRVDITKSEDVNERIDEIVDELRKLKAEDKNFKPWDNAPAKEKAKNFGKIAVKDNYFFRTNSEIREFFGRKNNCQRSFYTIDRKTGDHLWLPHLAIENNGEYRAATSAGHINLLSKDGKEIYEWVKGPKDDGFAGEDFRRITFAKSRNNLGENGYKFIGIFKFCGFREMEAKKGDKQKFRVFKLEDGGDVI